MKFIVDTQLPPKLASYLTQKGHDSIHTTFYPEGHLLNDKEIVKFAKKENRTVISKDSIFWTITCLIEILQKYYL